MKLKNNYISNSQVIAGGEPSAIFIAEYNYSLTTLKCMHLPNHIYSITYDTSSSPVGSPSFNLGMVLTLLLLYDNSTFIT